MKLSRGNLLTGAAALAGTGLLLNSSEGRAQQPDWREEYAYSLGLQAFVFSFPWLYLPTLRWTWVTQPNNPSTIYAPLNQFWKTSRLVDASIRSGGSPNNDTVYSVAWLDLRKEPIVVSFPAHGDRYFSVEMASMDSDNFAYAGTRTTGKGAGHYVIAGPDWNGTLPGGVHFPVAVPLQRRPVSRTPYALVFTRTLVYGPEDLPTVLALQQQYSLTPLSQFGKVQVRSANRDVFAPSPKTDPLGAWRTVNRAMTENPPTGAQAEMVKLFAAIGVGPGQDVDRMGAATKRGLSRAATDGLALLKDATKSGIGKRVNGWTYPPADMGICGLSGDFLTRAAVQCMAGIIANNVDEATYLNTTTDADGARLTGANNYEMRFAPGQMPPVNAFWSLTVYDNTFNLVANPLNRYKVGTYPKTLKPDSDGGLTIYLQRTSPGAEKESNWLPMPTGEVGWLILRTYLPDQSIVEQTWEPPKIQRR